MLFSFLAFFFFRSWFLIFIIMHAIIIDRLLSQVELKTIEGAAWEQLQFLTQVLKKKMRNLIIFFSCDFCMWSEVWNFACFCAFMWNRISSSSESEGSSDEDDDEDVRDMEGKTYTKAGIEVILLSLRYWKPKKLFCLSSCW